MNRRDRPTGTRTNRRDGSTLRFELNPIPPSSGRFQNSKLYQEWLKSQQPEKPQNQELETPQKSTQQIAKELQVTAGKLLATANKLMKT